MDGQIFSGVLLLCVISFSGKANSFCAMPSETLHADLTRSVLRSSDWLRQIYKDNNTKLFPYRAGSLITILRLAGHKPKTLLSEFKDQRGSNIEETLKNFLHSKNKMDGNLSGIPNPHLALIIQTVVSLCQDPEDFHGYNLIQPLLSGFALFKKIRNFGNYFGYSLAVIALCNSGHRVPEQVVQELLKGAHRKVSYHSSDIDSLILQALSCISDSSMQNEVDEASEKIVEQLITKQNKTSGAFGNQYSTAHVIMALQAARIHTDSYLCEKAMRNILSYQKEDGSFGTILANIRITAALLGESLISLRKYHCPVEQPPTKPPPMITVHVQLVLNVTNNTRTEPMVSVEMPLGKTVHNVLELAKLQNPCYAATYVKLAWGRSVTSICGVKKRPLLGYYWLIRVNGRRARYGIDGLRPKDGYVITFRYMKITF